MHPGQVDDGTGCPNCRSERWDEDECYCEWCGYEPDEDYEDELGHTGFYLHTEAGTAHVLGDPNMDEETAAALAKMIECAVKTVENGEIGE